MHRNFTMHKCTAILRLKLEEIARISCSLISYWRLADLWRFATFKTFRHLLRRLNPATLEQDTPPAQPPRCGRPPAQPPAQLPRCGPPPAQTLVPPTDQEPGTTPQTLTRRTRYGRTIRTPPRYVSNVGGGWCRGRILTKKHPSRSASRWRNSGSGLTSEKRPTFFYLKHFRLLLLARGQKYSYFSSATAWYLGFRIHGLGFGVQDSWFGILGPWFRVYDSGSLIPEYCKILLRMYLDTDTILSAKKYLDTRYKILLQMYLDTRYFWIFILFFKRIKSILIPQKGLKNWAQTNENKFL